MTLKQIFNTSAELDFPTVLPTLDLDFANTKALDPRITFTRSSGGSYVGADGLIKYAGVNEARFDHNPVTGESLGLLIEESRQNLLLQSNGFDTASWGKNSVTLVPNSITSPDGTTNAYKPVENTTNNLHRTSQIVSKSAVATTYTFSVFAKAGERNGLEFGMSDAGGYVDCFPNASTGTFSAVPAINGSWVLGSYGSIAYSNGWYRYYVTATTSAQSSVIAFIGTTRSVGVLNNYQGDGTSGIYIWGAQLEQASVPTSYIPTTTSTVTRSADNASMTGTNFSSWYRQDEGTVSIGCITRRPALLANSADFAITNSFTTTYTSRIVGWFNINSSPFISVFANNINIFLPYIGTPGNSTNIPIKKAIALATRNMRVATNGTIITGNLGNTTVPNYLPNDFNRLSIGYEGIFAGYLNGTISRLTYYPKALPQSQLQALTS